MKTCCILGTFLLVAEETKQAAFAELKKLED